MFQRLQIRENGNKITHKNMSYQRSYLEGKRQPHTNSGFELDGISTPSGDSK